MSVGRQLCATLMWTGADLRRYAELLDDFHDAGQTGVIQVEALELARRLEALLPAILAFEGEQLPQLRAAQLERDPL